MDSNHVDLKTRFPELSEPEVTISRIAEAFVAPEYARAALSLIASLATPASEDIQLGRSTVITAPHHYGNLFVTVGSWWLLNFHIADAERLEEGDDVEEIVPDDYEAMLKEEHALGGDDVEDLEEDEEEEDASLVLGDGDEEEVEYEATFYQTGTFLLDSTIVPHDTLFDREDLEFYAYDFPEPRISAERFYWGRMVWEPQDLEHPGVVESLRSAMNYILTYHAEARPFTAFHSNDFEKIVLDSELRDRVIAAADFGDVVIIDGEDQEGNTTE